MRPDRQAPALRLVEPASPFGAGDGLTIPGFESCDPSHSELWTAHKESTPRAQETAQESLRALVRFCELRDCGATVAAAGAAVHSELGCEPRKLRRLRARVEGLPRTAWLPALTPGWRGRGHTSEFSDAAKVHITAEYLNQNKTKVSVLTRRAKRKSRDERLGWIIPSDKTVKRFLDKLPGPLTILGRQGPAALERSFAPVRRTFEYLAINEVWESDGRRADVWVKFPDGTIARPFIVIWFDIRSRKVLSVRGYLNPCAVLTMVSFRDAIVNTGYIPRSLKLDNGREYANKTFSGGVASRYRFKIKPDDPEGIIKMMDISINWAPPGMGRNKLVESFWNCVSENVDKAPETQGAYVGKDVVSRPEESAKKNAIPISVYENLLKTALVEHNEERAHRGNSMNLQTPAVVYDEGLDRGLGRRPESVHLQMLLMGQCSLKPDNLSSEFIVNFPGYGPQQYFSTAFANLPLSYRQKKFTIWFDPQSPEAGIRVMDGGRFVADIPHKPKIPFSGGQIQAAAHAISRSKYVRGRKVELKNVKSAAANPGGFTLPAAGASLMLVHDQEIAEARHLVESSAAAAAAQEAKQREDAEASQLAAWAQEADAARRAKRAQRQGDE